MPSEIPRTPVPSEKPRNPVPSEKPCSPVPSEKPLSPVPSENPRSPVPSEKPCSPVPSEKPCRPVPSEKPLSPVPSENPRSPVPSEKPCSPVPSEKPCGFASGSDRQGRTRSGRTVGDHFRAANPRPGLVLSRAADGTQRPRSGRVRAESWPPSEASAGTLRRGFASGSDRQGRTRSGRTVGDHFRAANPRPGLVLSRAADATQRPRSGRVRPESGRRASEGSPRIRVRTGSLATVVLHRPFRAEPEEVHHLGAVTRPHPGDVVRATHRGGPVHVIGLTHSGGRSARRPETLEAAASSLTRVRTPRQCSAGRGGAPRCGPGPGS